MNHDISITYDDILQSVASSSAIESNEDINVIKDRILENREKYKDLKLGE